MATSDPTAIELAGRVALITGAGRGIGEAIALGLAARGARIAAVGRTARDLEAVAARVAGAGGEAIAVPADITSQVDLDRALADVARRLGPVDILVNNAGIGESAPLGKTDDTFWFRHLDLNLTAAFRLCRALAPAMASRGWGRIINVASVAGRMGFPYTAAYSASKAGLIGLTRALAAELGGRGVTSNAVCPGWVETELSARALANITAKTGLDAEAARARLADASPQKRFMTPTEIASAVVYLAGPAAAAVNGQAWNVDGGSLMS